MAVGYRYGDFRPTCDMLESFDQQFNLLEDSVIANSELLIVNIDSMHNGREQNLVQAFSKIRNCWLPAIPVPASVRADRVHLLEFLDGSSTFAMVVESDESLQLYYVTPTRQFTQLQIAQHVADVRIPHDYRLHAGYRLTSGEWLFALANTALDNVQLYVTAGKSAALRNAFALRNANFLGVYKDSLCILSTEGLFAYRAGENRLERFPTFDDKPFSGTTSEQSYAYCFFEDTIFAYATDGTGTCIDSYDLRLKMWFGTEVFREQPADNIYRFRILPPSGEVLMLLWDPPAPVLSVFVQPPRLVEAALRAIHRHMNAGSAQRLCETLATSIFELVQYLLSREA